MPVPNAMERQIKIHRDSNASSSLTPQIITPNVTQQAQQETRTWRQETYSTKKVVQGSTEPTVIQHSTTTKSQDLFSNKHNNDDRRGSNCSTTSNTSNTNKTTNLKSSTLVSKALQDFEEDFNNHVQDVRRNSKTTTTTTTQQQHHSLMPSSTPTMEIVPSGSRSASPNWMMGTDNAGDVPLTYEIVESSSGKMFQLLLTAREFSPEDLQVKLVDNTLTISGNHEERSPNGAYKQKSFSRTCTIPSGVRPEDLNCSLDSCGRLKITAPVPDLEPLTSQKSIKTITHQNNSLMNQNWENGTSDNMINVFDDNVTNLNTMGNEAVKQHSTKTVTKTVKTFKSVA